MDEDYYKLLGLARTASSAEIQKAYRKLARDCHPDLHPDDKGAKDKFQKIQRAYDILGDSEKRELYDRYGNAFESLGSGGQWQAPGAGTGPGFEDIDLSQLFGGQFDASGAAGFGDVFRRFNQAGGAGSGGRPGGTRRNSSRKSHRGGDLTHEMEIPFEMSVIGGKIALNVKRPGGSNDTIEVRVPPGIAPGQTIRCRGQGEPGGGIPGDLLITIQVASHAYYSRRAHDLIVRLPVTLSEAALGAKVEVPTPWGTISLKVPPGSSSGKRLRVKGHGVRTSKVQGDLYAELQIQLPESLDEDALELIRKLDLKSTANPRSALKW